jgi:hypothetical protein
LPLYFKESCFVVYVAPVSATIDQLSVVPLPIVPFREWFDWCLVLQLLFVLEQGQIVSAIAAA